MPATCVAGIVFIEPPNRGCLYTGWPGRGRWHWWHHSSRRGDQEMTADLTISAASRVVPIRFCKPLDHTVIRVTTLYRHNA
jgi:hypothetical protein